MPFPLDVLSQDSISLYPILNGYLLSKAFKIPECTICHDEYSSNDNEKQCCRTIRTHNEIEGDYSITCSICQTITQTSSDNRPDGLHNFLNELPEMTHQLEEMGLSKIRFCEECNEMGHVDKMRFCDECKIKICGYCTTEKHRCHETPQLLEEEANKMSDELRGRTINGIKTYRDNSFSELHKEIIQDIGKLESKLLLKVEELKNVAHFDDLQKKQEKCADWNNNFEGICEEYMLPLREYHTKIKKMIEDIDED